MFELKKLAIHCAPFIAGSTGRKRHSRQAPSLPPLAPYAPPFLYLSCWLHTHIQFHSTRQKNFFCEKNTRNSQHISTSEKTKMSRFWLEKQKTQKEMGNHSTRPGNGDLLTAAQGNFFFFFIMQFLMIFPIRLDAIRFFEKLEEVQLHSD